MKNNDPVEKYISGFLGQVQERLREVRSIISKHAPKAVESMAYGMPAYKLFDSALVYFAGYKQHIGFYALPSGHNEFSAGLSKFKKGKGSVRFPLDEPLPSKLIAQIVRFRVKENTAKHGTKKKSDPVNRKKITGSKRNA
jgi:uncharacterized protein YdhG (YjbR/CyaY superfamily)